MTQLTTLGVGGVGVRMVNGVRNILGVHNILGVRNFSSVRIGCTEYLGCGEPFFWCPEILFGVVGNFLGGRNFRCPAACACVHVFFNDEG